MVTRIVCLNFGVFSATGVVSAKQLVASPNQTSTATEQNVYTEKMSARSVSTSPVRSAQLQGVSKSIVNLNPKCTNFNLQKNSDHRLFQKSFPTA